MQRHDTKELEQAITDAPKLRPGEEFIAFPDAARGRDIKVVIAETRGNTIIVTDGRKFTRDQILTDEEAEIIRRKFAGKKFC